MRNWGEQLLGLVVLDAGVDDDVVAGDPVDGRRDAVLVARLQRVDHAEHLGRVAARRGWVREDQADRLLGVDDEDGADGEGDALGVDVGGVLVVEPACITESARISTIRQGGEFLHIVGIRNLAVLVANYGESQLAAGDLIDVLDPSAVRLDGVGRQADQLDAALGELRLELGEGAELGGADGRVVLGMGEEDDPFVADELVEVDGAGGGFGLEVGGNGSQAEAAGERWLAE